MTQTDDIPAYTPKRLTNLLRQVRWNHPGGVIVSYWPCSIQIKNGSFYRTAGITFNFPLSLASPTPPYTKKFNYWHSFLSNLNSPIYGPFNLSKNTS
jgi:hypothetical protein